MSARTPHRKRSLVRLYPLIGLVTIVVVAAFVYVSYTANEGLPFQSSYVVHALVPNADRLIKTDEVRIGGVRVGQVSSVSPRLGAGGKPYAVIGLSMSPSTGPLPIDTTLQVQSASVLGQTYVDLTPGTSSHNVPNGGTLPISDAASTVQLTDLLDIFDHATASSIQRTLGNVGAGLAGRGTAVNGTLSALARLLGPFTVLSQTLSARSTDLAGFLRGTEAFAGALAPDGSQLGDLVANASTTFGALASVRPQLGAAIDELAPAEQAASSALARLSTPLDQLATLTVRLRAAGALLPSTLTQINSTLRAGVPVVRRLPAFDAVLRTALKAVSRFSAEPATSGSVRKLTDALVAINPLLTLLTPAQLDCNVLGLYGRNFASAWGSLGSGVGPSTVTAGVLTAGATGEELQSAAPAPDLHINYLPNEDANECESGNEPYSTTSRDLSNPPGDQSRDDPSTSPPSGVTELAQNAGLLNAPPGTPR